MSALDDLAKTINEQYGNSNQTLGTVTGTDALASRSLIEVQLDTGSITNAFAWTQADIQVGADVVLSRIGDRDGVVWTVVAVNAPPASGDTDTIPNITIWGGHTFRAPRIPKTNGAWEVLNNTQYKATFGFDTYTRMVIDLQFSVAPIGNKVEYWLYGYDPIALDYDVAPPWQLQIGTAWKSADNKRWRTVFDLEAPGFDSEWIYDYDSAVFVLAIKRITATTTRGSAAGRILNCTITFGDVIECDPIEATLEATFGVTLAPTTTDTYDLLANMNVYLGRYYVDNPMVCSVDVIVKAP